MTIDLNVDLGEGGAFDHELTALASSVNIACGGHAGNIESMKIAADAAIQHQVAIGAHPSFPDREHFGRRELDLPLSQVSDFVAEQIENLATITRIHHIKPHGALYNQAQREPELAAAILKGINQVLPKTLIYTLPEGCLAEAARSEGHLVIGEGFLDRAYLPNGQLKPRSQRNAVLEDPAEVLAQTLKLAQSQQHQTLCLHSDSKDALTRLTSIRKTLLENNFQISPPHLA